MTVLKKKVGVGSIKYVKYSEAKPGDVIAVGIFQGTELVKNYNPDQPDVPQHTLVDDEDNIIKLNSAGQLNHLLKSVTPGSLIEIVFLGKEKIKSKSGKTFPMNQFEVHELVEE